MRLSSCVHILVLLCVGSCVYTVANKYNCVQKNVRMLNAQIEEEHENIRVLQAEWAFLTSPVRLEKIAAANFQLGPMDGRQLVALNTVPMTDSFADDGKTGTDHLVAENPGQELVERYATAAASMPAAQMLPVLAAMPVGITRGGNE